MPQDRRKDRHKFRATIADAEALWTRLGDVVGDGDRSRITRELWAWYLREPGAKMPKRPERRAEEPEAPG